MQQNNDKGPGKKLNYFNDYLEANFLRSILKKTGVMPK